MISMTFLLAGSSIASGNGAREETRDRAIDDSLAVDKQKTFAGTFGREDATRDSIARSSGEHVIPILTSPTDHPGMLRAARDPPPILHSLPGTNAPCLEYRAWYCDPGDEKVILTLSPVLNCIHGCAVRIGVSLNGVDADIISVVQGNHVVKNSNADWARSVQGEAR
jgi:hypothetical protein